MSSQDIEISRRLRARLLLVAWAVALLIPDLSRATHDVRYALFAVVWVWAFPTGVSYFLFPDDALLEFTPGIVGLLLIWLCYLGLTLLAFRQHRSLRYFLVYGLLCVLLLLNAAGCAMMMEHRVGRFGSP
jgi:hypothetical protein